MLPISAIFAHQDGFPKNKKWRNEPILRKMTIPAIDCKSGSYKNVCRKTLHMTKKTNPFNPSYEEMRSAECAMRNSKQKSGLIRLKPAMEIMKQTPRIYDLRYAIYLPTAVINHGWTQINRMPSMNGANFGQLKTEN
jgi:hypothetical protein